MRIVDRTQLREGLLAARQYTNALLADLSDAQLAVPFSPVLNPFLWEYGHVAWFAEYFALRRAEDGTAERPSRLAAADRWYDSGKVAHAHRWSLDLPSREQTERYASAVLADVLAALDAADGSASALYPFQLVLYHEDMHAEAFTYMRHTVGLPMPQVLAASVLHDSSGAPVDDVAVPGGLFALGAPRGAGFVFDNEKWAHDVRIAPFSIAASLVSNGMFAAFVADGGYARDELWTDAGRAWRDAAGRRQPRDWRCAGAGWQLRWYDDWQPLAEDAPLRNVTAHEAQAYCRWAKRRLPTEAEWECAAVTGAIAPRGLWEWTASDFAPYPGFSADAYAEYSQPWFHTHRVLRGASFATPQRLHHPRFRNFYRPERDDIFAGFRTCAPG